MRKIIILALGLSLIGCEQTAKKQTPLTESEIDALAERALDAFNIPGIGIGIIKDGKIVHAKGYGVKDIRTKDPVDADTLFQIASNSKAYTAATIALLIDEGKMSWDDKVTDHIPEFKMFEPYVTREFTVRDMLSHRSGLPLGAGDLLFFPDPIGKLDTVLKAIETIPPSSSFRSKYDYDNLMYILAGEVVARVSGKPWSEFVEERIFTPLKMDDCRATYSRVPKDANIATPHAMSDSILEVRDWVQHEFTGSVGGINCSINSSLKWLKTQLNHGVMDNGEPLFSKDRHGEMWSPQTIMSTRPPQDVGQPVRMEHYALGWHLSNLPTHHQVISHTGGLDGMLTSTVMLPEENLGILVFTNQANGWARGAIISEILKGYVGDIVGAMSFDERVMASKESSSGAVEQMQAIWDARDTTKTMSAPLIKYTGVYSDRWYGEVEIKMVDDTLRFISNVSPNLKGTIKHFEGDTFIVEWDDRSMVADAYMDFEIGYAMTVTNFTMRKFDPRTDFSFDFWDLDLRRIK